MRLTSERSLFIGYLLGGRQKCRGTKVIPQHPVKLRLGLRRMSPRAAGGKLALAVKRWEWGERARPALALLDLPRRPTSSRHG